VGVGMMKGKSSVLILMAVLLYSILHMTFASAINLSIYKGFGFGMFGGPGSLADGMGPTIHVSVFLDRPNIPFKNSDIVWSESHYNGLLTIVKNNSEIDLDYLEKRQKKSLKKLARNIMFWGRPKYLKELGKQAKEYLHLEKETVYLVRSISRLNILEKRTHIDSCLWSHNQTGNLKFEICF
jgi:hypothetical protein